MVDLHAQGSINFETFDPSDSRSWLRLTFLMDVEERRRAYDFTTASMLRSSIVASNSRLSTESINENLGVSAEKLSKLLKLSYPWQHFAESNRLSENEQLRLAYEEQFGKPGEERYDKMVALFNSQLAEKRRNGT